MDTQVASALAWVVAFDVTSVCLVVGAVGLLHPSSDTTLTPADAAARTRRSRRRPESFAGVVTVDLILMSVRRRSSASR